MNKTRIIKVFEDRQQKIDLKPEEMKDLLLMKNILKNNLTLQADGNLLVRHLVGFIQVKKTRLLIYPKISSNSVGDIEYEKSFSILMNLLSFSGFEKVRKITNPQTMSKYKGDILESFIGLFIDELLDQFKKDVNRGYDNQLENQGFIKGKIDFPETIKKNSFKKHLHYVKYDEFSENILLNKIFKTIVQNLIIRTDSKENKLKLRQSLLWLEDVTTVKLSDEIWDKIIFTRQNLKYEVAFNMAKLFYYNSSPSLNKGDEYTFSFLVPVNQLFELYIYKVLRLVPKKELNALYQTARSYLASINGKKHIQLKPDITLIKGDEIYYILDAKYKEIVFKKQTLLISEADVYQMLAYGVGFNCKKIALIYPKFLSDDPSEPMVRNLEIQNNKNVISIKLIKIDLELSPTSLATQLTQVFQGNAVSE